MIWKRSGERRIIWWNLLTMFTVAGLSFALINTEEGLLFYVLISLLFLCVGIFVKRPYVFLGIMIFVLVFVFIVRDGFLGGSPDENGSSFHFDFFMNRNT